MTRPLLTLGHVVSRARCRAGNLQRLPLRNVTDSALMNCLFLIEATKRLAKGAANRAATNERAGVRGPQRLR